jgi:DNA polymerase III subunit delta'
VWRIIGQPHLISLFESSIEGKTVSHAYLILGPEHIGKTTLTLDISMALNCEAKTRPCGECASCKKILKNMHPDIFEISLETIKASEQKTKREIGIEEIRRLQQLASLSPYEGKYKIFIINGADLLSNEASNCLLKTLEEPSPNVIIFLLASDETNLLPTIVSRCQKIQLQTLSIKETQNILVDRYGATIEKAKLASYLSEGRLGEAINIAGDEKQVEKRYKIIAEFLPLLESDINQRFSYVSQLEDDRKSIQEVFVVWLNLWRDLMLVKCGSRENVTNINYISELDKFAERLSIIQIKEFIENLRNSLSLIIKNVNIRLLLEVLMFDMPFINK